MSTFLNLIKQSDKGKTLAKSEYDIVQSLTQAGKSEYALQCATERPLYREAIRFMGDVISDQDTEIGVLQDQLKLSDEGQKKLKALEAERKAFDTPDEKDRKILASLKAKMDEYKKKGEEITSINIIHEPKPLQIPFKKSSKN